jgi:hypothetical protein
VVPTCPTPCGRVDPCKEENSLQSPFPLNQSALLSRKISPRQNREGSGTGDAASPAADRGEKLSKSLMALCQEIAGALLSHHAAGSDLRIARERIARRLMETLRCERSQVDKLIELSKELIHANAYGRYRRNPLELSLLVQAAMGQKLFDATNN